MSGLVITQSNGCRDGGGGGGGVRVRVRVRGGDNPPV